MTEQKSEHFFKNSDTLNLLNLIAEESSKNEKIELIRKCLINEEFCLTIDKALNPHVLYFIKKWEAPRILKSPASCISLKQAITSITRHLEGGKLRGKAAEKFILALFEQLTENDAEVLSRIIRKDLKSGFSAALVNKADPNRIPKYPCMLATKHTDKSIKNLEYPCYSQIKSDGRRNNLMFNPNKQIACYSRSGKQLNVGDYFDFLFKDLKSLGDINIIIDGELIVLDEDNTPLPRAISNGLLSKWSKGSIEAPNVQFIVWDIIPYNKFMKGEYQCSYDIRLETLEHVVSKINNDKIKVVDYTVVKNERELMDSFHDALDNNEEGIIAKNKNMIFEDRRSKHQIKFKLENVNELKIVGLNEGVKSRMGKLGSFKLESQDGLISVNVGSGLTEEQCVEYWNESLIGKIVSIKHNGLIKNLSGEYSLFLPIFIEIRRSKRVADKFDDFT